MFRKLLAEQGSLHPQNCQKGGMRHQKPQGPAQEDHLGRPLAPPHPALCAQGPSTPSLPLVCTRPTCANVHTLCRPGLSPPHVGAQTKARRSTVSLAVKGQEWTGGGPPTVPADSPAQGQQMLTHSCEIPGQAAWRRNRFTRSRRGGIFSHPSCTPVEGPTLFQIPQKQCAG